MTDKKRYLLKHPVTIALVDEFDDKDAEIVLRTNTNGLLFISAEKFHDDFEEVDDE